MDGERLREISNWSEFSNLRMNFWYLLRVAQDTKFLILTKIMPGAVLPLCCADIGKRLNQGGLLIICHP